MPAVQSVKNQYLGINAHLHSFWQAAGTWNRFHKIHMIHLLADLRAQLPRFGYAANLETSLQNAGANPNHPGLYAVSIHEDSSTSEVIGWIEMLSPRAKGTLRTAQSYQENRLSLVRQNLAFVELDYLHETPPTFAALPDYARVERGASPYRIIVMDSRPDLESGTTTVYPLDVDQPFGKVNIPLQSRDVLAYDFGAVYQHTFERGCFGSTIDYAKIPVNFDRYSLADQTRIARRMAAVLNAQKAGLDLESPPYPTEPLPLEAALAQIERFAT